MQLPEAHLVPLPLEESNILWEYDHVLEGPEEAAQDSEVVLLEKQLFECVEFRIGFCSSRVGMALSSSVGAKAAFVSASPCSLHRRLCSKRSDIQSRKSQSHSHLCMMLPMNRTLRIS
jgi:hypothetical protein